MKAIDSNIVQSAMKSAKHIRLCSDFSRVKLGAVIFTNKKVLVGGSNTTKTSPMQYEYNQYRSFQDIGPDSITPCCHAEIAALTRLKNLYPNVNPKDLNILVYRENADGKYVMAKPCPACEQALRDYGIKHVYYTGNNSICCEEYV